MKSTNSSNVITSLLAVVIFMLVIVAISNFILINSVLTMHTATMSFIGDAFYQSTDIEQQYLNKDGEVCTENHDHATYDVVKPE